MRTRSLPCFPVLKSVAAILFLLFPVVAAALPPEIRTHHLLEQQWGVDQGLPQTTVQAIIQSHDGMLWIGTQDGLVRFDGIDFQIFSQDEYPGLAHPYINSLAEDGNGRVWVGTEQGVSLVEAGRIRHIQPATGMDPGPVREIAHDPNRNIIWAAADNGLFRIDLTNGITMSRHDGIDTPLFSVTVGPSGQVFAGGRGEIWTTGRNTSHRHALGPGDETLEVRDLTVRDEQLWQGMASGLRVAPVNTPTEWTERFLDTREVESLLFDSDDNLWVSTVSGLFRKRPDSRELISVVTDSISEAAWLRDLHEDRSGNLWVGTHGQGLVRFSVSAFRRYATRDGLVNNIVWSFYQTPGGEIWAGSSEDGAFRMTEDGRFEQPIPPDALPHSMTMGFLLDDQNRFWVATRGGIAWFDGDNLSPLPIPDGFPEAAVFGISQDSEGRVWLASRDGLYWYRDGNITRLGPDDGLTQVRTRDVREGPDGDIWVATDTGLFRGGPDGMEAIAPDTAIPDYSASALYVLNDTMWAVMQGALVRFPDGEPQIYTDQHNLKTQIGSFLALDEEGNVWSTTHEGVLRIPLEQFREFDRGERERFEPSIYGDQDDPIVAQCNGGHGQAGLFLPEQNTIWCPSLVGALRLDIERVQQLPEAPTPVIRQVRAAGRGWASLDQADGATLTLPPEARDLEIDFSGLYFRYPEGVRYRVRLAGYDEAWQDIGTRRTAFYTNLPPGNYRFLVHARNEAGVESDIPANVTLHLEPRYYQTVWFRGVALLGLLLLAYGVWRFSVRRLRRRRIALEKVVRKRTRQLHEVNRQLEQASVTDPLTGLRNRRYLDNQLPHDVAQVDRAYTRHSENPNRDITFLMIDLDHFKRINDDCGHRVGDQILTQFAELLAEQVRESDYVIRWGGEEFLVVARHSERAQAAACAQRIMNAVRGIRFATDQGEKTCSCSIGVTSYPAIPERPEALDWEDVIELADAANYIAKEEGRDRWVEIRISPDAPEKGFMRRFREGAESMAASGEIRILREADGDGR